MSTLQEQLFQIISREAGIPLERITLQSTLQDLQIDSLDAIEILFDIEEHFKISLPERDPNFDTASVQGLVTAVESLLAQTASGGAG